MTTTYVVLHGVLNDADALDHPVDGIVFAVLGRFDASSGKQACRAAAATLADEAVAAGVDLVAVPARSWESGSVRLQAQVQTRLRIVT